MRSFVHGRTASVNSLRKHRTGSMAQEASLRKHGTGSMAQEASLRKHGSGSMAQGLAQEAWLRDDPIGCLNHVDIRLNPSKWLPVGSQPRLRFHAFILQSLVSRGTHGLT